ncbi:MAG: TlpA family protein disulfide reductase, partial [Mucilaginibacter sp.]
MKLKIRFRAMLLQLRRRINLKDIFGTKPEDRRQFRYVVSLLILWLIIFLMGMFKCKAETRPLRIGEKMPDIRISNLINYGAGSAKVSDFKGRILVIDFWASWCGACLREMPEAVKLGKTYSKQIQIISVTGQSEQVIRQFLQHNEFVRDLHPVIAFNDIVLKRMFPHKLVPHLVWIAPDGTFLGTTTQNDLAPAVVEQILSTGRANFSDPKNDNLTFDPDKPLFVDGNGGTPEYRYKCLLTNYQPGIQSTLGSRTGPEGITIRGTNINLGSLLLKALGAPLTRFGRNRFLIERGVPDSLIFPGNGPAHVKYLCCFELLMRDAGKKEAEAEMLHYLEHYFGIHAEIAVRDVDCLELVSVGNHSKLIYTRPETTDNLED